MIYRRLVFALWFIGSLLICILLISFFTILFMKRDFPSLDPMTEYRPEEPLRVLTSDGVLIGEFGTERRQFVPFDKIPLVMKNAVLAIEDYRFYEHSGVDVIGIFRASIADLTQQTASQGASTITMQIARNFFLSRKKTLTRKAYEILLAFEIERNLSKDQILCLYMNQIYLGEHTYGFAEAAHTYFGKNLNDLSIAEAAMLAGLPKAPAVFNPIVNPDRAKLRQIYILKRMLDLNYIGRKEYEEAVNSPIHIVRAKPEYAVHAEYVAEMVRQIMYSRYGEAAYTMGITVKTTIDSRGQSAAYQAVREGVINYEKGRGYRGPEGYIQLPEDDTNRQAAIANALRKHPSYGDLRSAVVLAATPNQVTVQLNDGEVILISGAGLRGVESSSASQAKAQSRIKSGSIVRVIRGGVAGAEIVQLPGVEGAMVSMSPKDGAILTLVGGFDFGKNRFNHVTQAWRQPGSTFKPFIYSAALEKGLGPATIIPDEPLHFPPAGRGRPAWDPRDYDHPQGPMSLRAGLERSKNLVSIRILSYIGTDFARDYVTQRFGFDRNKTPAILPLALGANLVTPLQLVTGYSVFANQGYGVAPFLIREIEDSQGRAVYRHQGRVAGRDAPRMISARNAYIVDSLLHSVATVGVGAGTNALGRNDIQGKTGTTNNAKDGWFAGYQPTVATVAWLGYDQPRSLGARIYGSQLALPMWVEYMRQALLDVSQQQQVAPDDVVTVNGELYYSDRRPGDGFVAQLGDKATVNGPIAVAVDAMTTETDVPDAVSSVERAEVLDLFRRADEVGGSNSEDHSPER